MHFVEGVLIVDAVENVLNLDMADVIGSYLDLNDHAMLQAELPVWEICAYWARHNQLGELQQALANGHPLGNALPDAGAAGNLEILKWAQSEGYAFSELVCRQAAGNGHLHILRWLRENGCPWNEPTTCASAALGGHLQVLQWARANGCPWDKWTCACAVRGGHLQVLEWLRGNACPWDEMTSRQASQWGVVDVLEWLTRRSVFYTESVDVKTISA